MNVSFKFFYSILKIQMQYYSIGEKILKLKPYNQLIIQALKLVKLKVD